MVSQPVSEHVAMKPESLLLYGRMAILAEHKRFRINKSINLAMIRPYC